MKIYEFQKNALEKVVIEITTYQDRGYLNIRVWYDASRGQSVDWRPSPKGITLAVELIPELTRGLSLAADFIGPGKEMPEKKGD